MTDTPGDEPRPHEPGSHDDQTQAGGAGSTSSGEQPGYWEQRAREEGRTTPYPQQPYPAAPPPGQTPGYYPPPGQVQYAPDHPKATTSMVMGILGLVVCGFLAPFAWSMGKRTMNEIDASNGTVGGRGAAQAGYIMGIIGTVLLIIGLVVVVLYVIAMFVFVGTSAVTST